MFVAIIVLLAKPIILERERTIIQLRTEIKLYLYCSIFNSLFEGIVLIVVYLRIEFYLFFGDAGGVSIRQEQSNQSEK